MSDATFANLDDAGVSEPVGTFLFDAGYWSNANGTNVSDDANGQPSRLIATTKSHKQRQALRDKGTTTGPPPPGATPSQAMEHRLRTVEGQALYSKRQHTVEPIFGDIKHDRGFRRSAAADSTLLEPNGSSSPPPTTCSNCTEHASPPKPGARCSRTPTETADTPD